MNHKQVREIAHKLGHSNVDFEFRTALNTGRDFEVGYVYVNKHRVLFCKRGHATSTDAFYLCNEFRVYDTENVQ